MNPPLRAERDRAALLDALRDGAPPPFGSLTGRRGSAPEGGKTVLIDEPEPPQLQAALTEQPAQQSAGAAEAGETNNAG